MKRRGLAAALLLGAPIAASAHSFGQLYNLPLPFWMYLYGAAAALAVSFVVAGWFLRAPAGGPPQGRDLTDASWVRALRRARLIPALRGTSVFLLLLCMATGFFGNPNPYANFNMTFFWIVFVLGFTYLTALAGNLYAVISPWRVLADLLERLRPGFGAGRRPYPERLGYWPAVVQYGIFIGIELFARIQPFGLSILLVTYTALTLGGVALFGRNAWFRYGEFFAVFLRLVALMAPLEYTPPARDATHGRLRLRAPFAGVLEQRAESVSLLVFSLFMLSSTAFDGLRETVAWANLYWRDLYPHLKPLVGGNPIAAYPAMRRLYLGFEIAGLAVSPFLYLAVFWIFVGAARVTAGSRLAPRELALRFGLTLLPIALVYNITHYYTLILTQGVRIVSLASDPFGRGWNVLGTASWLQSPAIPSMNTVWHTQVTLIVAGHIVSVWLAHLEALRTFPTRKGALLSQLPLLLLMLLFTTVGLWILSQPLRPPV